jgi:hypothetical protein
VKHLKIAFYPFLESLFAAIADKAEKLRQRFAICSTCGANRYTGKPCIGEDNAL